MGRASVREPRLVDLRWGDPAAPRVTLVGKGVCFDTGGLDIKPSSNMLLMKKDMGGAAVMLALAHCIMALDLPVRLRLLIPAVENSVGGAAFRPGDVLTMRSGTTVEITNTDAEGRLVLADALAEADVEEPALLLDGATLDGCRPRGGRSRAPRHVHSRRPTGRGSAARGQQQLRSLVASASAAPYLSYMKSPVADLANASSKAFAGSITAALFLKEFVKRTRGWAHLEKKKKKKKKKNAAPPTPTLSTSPCRQTDRTPRPSRSCSPRLRASRRARQSRRRHRIAPAGSSTA